MKNDVQLPAANSWPRNRRLLTGHLNGLYARAGRALAGRRVGVIATSLGQGCITANESTLASNTRSWIAFAHFFSGGIFEMATWHETRAFTGWEPLGVAGTTRYFRGLNAGVSGQNCAQILARKEFLVDQLDCDLVIIDCGTNDMGSQTKEYIQSAREELCDYFLNAGIAVVLLPVLSRAVSSWPANGTQRKKAAWINSRSRHFCQSRKGCYIFDWNAQWVDSANANGEPFVGASSDGIHFNPAGAVAVGEALAKFLATLLPPAQPRVWSQNDVYDATENPFGNLLTNQFCTGTTGTRTGATVTGSVASNMRVELSSGNATVACSKETRTDNRGDYQVMAITTAANGAQDSLIFFRTDPANTTHTLGGKWVEASIEVDISASNILQGATLYLEDNNGTGKMTVEGLEPYTAGQNDYTPFVIQKLPNKVLKGLIVTPAMLLPANSTILRYRLEVRVAATADANPASVTVKAGAIELRQVQDPRAVVNYQTETL